MTSFPNFYGVKGENANYFLDDLEMALLTSGRDDDDVKVKAFSLVLRDTAKAWFQGLAAEQKADWETLRETFLAKYVADNTPEKLWQRLTFLQQGSLGSYACYESHFLKLWNEWEASLPEGEKTPSFLQKERFLAGLSPILQEKVRAKFPEGFEDAKEKAKAKDHKMLFQAGYGRREPPHNIHEPPPPQPEPVLPSVSKDPHLNLLQKMTN